MMDMKPIIRNAKHIRYIEFEGSLKKWNIDKKEIPALMLSLGFSLLNKILAICVNLCNTYTHKRIWDGDKIKRIPLKQLTEDLLRHTGTVLEEIFADDT